MLLSHADGTVQFFYYQVGSFFFLIQRPMFVRAVQGGWRPPRWLARYPVFYVLGELQLQLLC